MRGVGAGVRELLPAVGALEGLLAAVDAQVLLEVVLELERLLTVVALVLADGRAVDVADHVPLQAVHIVEAFRTYFAGLSTKRNTG